MKIVRIKESDVIRLKKLFIILLCFIICFIFINQIISSAESNIVAQYGSHGKIVFEIQTYLYKLNYIKKSQIDYSYGKITREAVKSFQLEHILEETGIVDTETYNLLKESAANQDYFEYTVLEGDTIESICIKYNLSIPALLVYNKLNEDSQLTTGMIIKIPQNIMYLNKTVSRGRITKVQAIPWSIVDKFWHVGEIAMITDYETKKFFYVRRIGGRLHSDSVLVTKNDTKILYSLNQNFTWKRRGVIVSIHGQRIAGSINCQPHKKQQMICVHFEASRIHGNNMIDEDHQEKIEEVEMDEENEY